MVRKKTLGTQKNISICGKILLQMNAKIGQALWVVPRRHKFWDKKKIMYGGLSVYRNQKQQKRGMSPQHSKQIDE